VWRSQGQRRAVIVCVAAACVDAVRDLAPCMCSLTQARFTVADGTGTARMTATLTAVVQLVNTAPYDPVFDGGTLPEMSPAGTVVGTKMLEVGGRGLVVSAHLLNSRVLQALISVSGRVSTPTPTPPPHSHPPGTLYVHDRESGDPTRSLACSAARCPCTLGPGSSTAFAIVNNELRLLNGSLLFAGWKPSDTEIEVRCTDDASPALVSQAAIFSIVVGTVFVLLLICFLLLLLLFFFFCS
jgi:hypothetical protein